MCWKDTCATCKKPTWAGCGKHIEAALEGVPLSERCVCKREDFSGEQGNCSKCGEWFQASSGDFLTKVFEAHIGLSEDCKDSGANLTKESVSASAMAE